VRADWSSGPTASVTSFDRPTARNSTDVVNQIVFHYDGWGNVSESDQSHDGEVAAGTPNGTATVMILPDRQWI
jgi:hypothetical protein